jgi:hypothetical protein
MGTGPRISFVEKQGDLLVITFSDGRCALYTPEVLIGMLSETIQVLDHTHQKKENAFEELPNYEYL